MSDVAGYWARQLEKVPLSSEPWPPVHAPIVPRQPEADTVKELFWKMRAERLQRELDALKHPYFWLGREAE